jgi:N-sulfoglucosamine sulfohydrolase
VGVLGKVVHSTPYKKFQWDLSYNIHDLGQGRNPALYKQYAKEFFDDAAASGKPFFLMANSHDPHRPFYGNDDPSWYQPGPEPMAVPPSHAFVPADVRTPGFLPDLKTCAWSVRKL